MSYKSVFAGNIEVSLGTAWRILAKYPSSASALLKVSGGLKQAEKRRNQNAAEGVEVPPLLIASTTDRCNLKCAGCYACAKHHGIKPELSKSRINELLDEASALGVSIVMLAGGEPLLNRDWLDAVGYHDELLGVVFTNGTLMDDSAVQWFASHRHVIPAISIEGTGQQTDLRRGAGVYDKVMQSMQTLHKNGIPFGVSVTMTSSNMDTVLQDDFLNEYIAKGCHLFVFVEYVPVEPGTQPLVLSMQQKHRLNEFCKQSMKTHAALCIPFPGDEDVFGGCLAAGRGFIHISTGGDVEPCPFAPFSDQNLSQVSLKEALSSEFLSTIRKNHHLLKEGNGGCALWNNRQWLEQIL